VPSSAKALSINVTVAQPAASGDLRLLPGDLSTLPTVSSINFSAGQTRSNNAVLSLASDSSGGLKVLNDSAGSVHLILDVSGYFETTPACQTTTPPAISFSFVPPLLSTANVQGNVAFTTTPCIASDFSVALFIQVPGFTGSSYICKPFADAPLTPIASDGSWTAAYATGGMDIEATEIWAFLVAPGFTWPCFADTLPTVDGSSVFAVVSVDR
jgi:hypothetical protein